MGLSKEMEGGKGAGGVSPDGLANLVDADTLCNSQLVLKRLECWHTPK